MFDNLNFLPALLCLGAAGFWGFSWFTHADIVQAVGVGMVAVVGFSTFLMSFGR